MSPAQNLVSESSNESHFFEGVEKLLEVWFTRKDKNTSGCDLRKIPRQQLERMLINVQCLIISFSSNKNMDAFVLSESSLFVSQSRFILKTCGTTTPLECMDDLMDLVVKYSGFDGIENVFYSRKNFERPELQGAPHRHFEDEVRNLDKIFAGGSAYCYGALNRDHWYLYALNPLETIFHGKYNHNEPDQTIEILMTQLDPKVMEIFYTANTGSGKEATIKSGIDQILPNMKVDDFLFEPCGYSMNGIVKDDKFDTEMGQYCTIHITPEPEFSYASFESNVPLTSYIGLLQRVLNVFHPGKFMLCFIANRSSLAAESHKELQKLSHHSSWIRENIEYSSFQNYELTYAHFIRFPS